MVATDPLSLAFAALADPTRREILSRLARGPATVGELAEPFSISGPAVSQHLKVLERAGMVARTAQAQWRTLSLQAEPLDEVSAWIDRQRREWSLRLDALEQHLERMKRETPENRKPRRKNDEHHRSGDERDPRVLDHPQLRRTP